MRRTVIHFTDTAGFGGAEQMLLTTLAGLDQQRWRCVLMHYPGAGTAQLAASARDLEIETHPVPRTSSLAADLAQLARAIRSERAVLMHAHLIGAMRCTRGMLAARLAGVQGVIATQQLYPRSLSRRTRMRQRFISILVDRYIAVSHAMARTLREALAFRNRIAVIHNAVDLVAFAEKESYRVPDVFTDREGRPTVLTVARLNKQKGLEYLIAAAPYLPGTRFLIAGEGPDREALEMQARALNVADRVVFLGQRGDVRDLLAACDVFVLPSLFEGLPVSILEAMAVGKPVIATAIGGTDEAIVHRETGLLVPPADPAGLASALQLLLEDSSLRQRIGDAGRARVRQNFSAEAMIEQLSGVYHEVLRERHASAA